MPIAESIGGVVLAGGRSRRMGEGDKFLRTLGNHTLLECVIERVAPQVSTLMIAANGNTERLRQYWPRIIADSIPDFAGPLAGILSALEALRESGSATSLLLSVPADTPWLPLDLVERLHDVLRAEAAEIAVACSGPRDHPVIALWPVQLERAIRHALVTDGEHSLQRFQARFRVARAQWPDTPHDPFFNINTPEQLRLAESLLQG
jgi:molybdenum cofactor guanylyltransferase